MPGKQFSGFPLIVPTLPRLWTTLSPIRGSETQPPLWEGGHAVGNLRFRYPKLREPTFTEFPTECTSAPVVFCTGYFSSRRAVRLMLMRLRGNRTVRPSLRRTYCINKSVYKYVITRASGCGRAVTAMLSRSLVRSQKSFYGGIYSGTIRQRGEHVRCHAGLVTCDIVVTLLWSTEYRDKLL